MQIKAPIIGLTGSNGKTTSKELISSVLAQKYRVHFTKGNFNNHIGVPLTLLEMPNDTEIAVIEMGANHQGEIDFLSNIAAPSHGLITNIGKAHLEGFGGIEGVKKGKSELYRYLLKKKDLRF
ncbi:MAG: Mur ligase family protein [Saprospiraceae bacterium]